MNIIIKPSSNRLKKFDAIIDDKKKIVLVRKVQANLLYIKMKTGKIDTLIDIRKMRIGMIPQQLVFIVDG